MGVGIMLCLIKHSRPDICNSVRELSKVADGAHLKVPLRTIKYVLGTEDHGLLIQPQLNNDGFYLEVIADSTRLSVHGYVLYFCGAPIAWKSKAGKSFTLSSTEAAHFRDSKGSNF
jgi:hypothetical protein